MYYLAGAVSIRVLHGGIKVIWLIHPNDLDFSSLDWRACQIRNLGARCQNDKKIPKAY